MSIETLVLGPAYLDRVLRVAEPLVEAGDAPLDQSVEGAWEFGEGLVILDPEGSRLELVAPESWPGPNGRVVVDRRLGDAPGGWRRRVTVVSHSEDLGGMGAGFASAMGGTLVSVLGPEDDPLSRRIADLLRREAIEHRVLRVAHPADWTLLITSGEHGDKLPVGFRGAQRACDPAAILAEARLPSRLRVVAGLPNALARAALSAPGEAVRLFAPTVRNMVDQETPITRFAESVDLLCCNRREWGLLEGREQVAWRVPVLAITEGPSGSVVRFTRPDGDPGRVVVPAFPRARPPRDTNRAGEAYAATLARVLIEEGWTAGVIAPDLARLAATRASAAAALVLDRLDFGFPTAKEIDQALADGIVA